MDTRRRGRLRLKSGRSCIVQNLANPITSSCHSVSSLSTFTALSPSPERSEKTTRSYVSSDSSPLQSVGRIPQIKWHSGRRSTDSNLILDSTDARDMPERDWPL
jgi:hypothetical protein